MKHNDMHDAEHKVNRHTCISLIWQIQKQFLDSKYGNIYIYPVFLTHPHHKQHRTAEFFQDSTCLYTYKPLFVPHSPLAPPSYLDEEKPMPSLSSWAAFLGSDCISLSSCFFLSILMSLYANLMEALSQINSKSQVFSMSSQYIFFSILLISYPKSNRKGNKINASLIY